MVAYGKKAKAITDFHSKSIYQFDEFSPYAIAMKMYNAKILLLGMGRSTHKITAFHCASYDARKSAEFYKNCYNDIKKCTVVYSGKNYNFEYIDRSVGVKNNKKVFRSLFYRIPKKSVIHKGYSIILFNAQDAYDLAYEFCIEGGRLYKR